MESKEEILNRIRKAALEKYNPFTGDEDMDGIYMAYMAFEQGADFVMSILDEYAQQRERETSIEFGVWIGHECYNVISWFNWKFRPESKYKKEHPNIYTPEYLYDVFLNEKQK